jgi:hypothetical protein
MIFLGVKENNYFANYLILSYFFDMFSVPVTLIKGLRWPANESAWIFDAEIKKGMEPSVLTLTSARKLILIMI